MKSKISIVIIVKNDRGIADTLAAVTIQKKSAPTEIIVVDASKPDRLEDIRKKYPDVRWYHFIPSVPNKTTIPEQRNFGIRKAEGDIVVFIDANCVPSEHWLVELTKPLLDGSEMITAGPVYSTDPKQMNYYFPESIKGDYITLAGSGNLAFAKKIIDKVGEFDESFLFSSDTDFTWRCGDAGYKIRYIRAASITHDYGNLKDEMKRSFNYGKGRARIFRKHPKALKELFGGSIYIPVYTIYLLALPLTFYIWWYPFVIVLACLKNIGNKPFKTVFLNLIYTLGVWVGFLGMIF